MTLRRGSSPGIGYIEIPANTGDPPTKALQVICHKPQGDEHAKIKRRKTACDPMSELQASA
jgi:hypothetical protein